MTSVVELFPKSRKLAFDTKQQLSQVQNEVLHPSELFLSLEELNRQLNIMEGLVNNETPAQREMWRRKIIELKEQSISIRRQAEYYERVNSVGLRQQREREELMAMRRRRNRGGAGNGDTSTMDDLAEESDSLASSQNMVGEIIASGQASLSSLVEHRSRLKGVKRAVFDIGNKLGLSNSTMRIIERRDITDAYLVFGGMAVTLLVLYLCYLR